MGTILESTKELAKRFGVETEEQTIKDQIDAITESIDQNFNGSVDIASAVSEFAKNDNPDARLGTKNITENGTYTALDDELDGYSSVTVDTSFNSIETKCYDAKNGRLLLLRSKTGSYTYDLEISNATIVLCDPVTAVYEMHNFDTGSFTFTPADDFSGFYWHSSGESSDLVETTGDTITPGDGKMYNLIITRVEGVRTYVISLESNRDFTFIIS